VKALAERERAKRKPIAPNWRGSRMWLMDKRLKAMRKWKYSRAVQRSLQFLPYFKDFFVVPRTQFGSRNFGENAVSPPDRQ
jgi:hypothetical protein